MKYFKLNAKEVLVSKRFDFDGWVVFIRAGNQMGGWEIL